MCENSAAIVRAKSCLAANRQETAARKAARDLFASLSNGEDYITTAQLERKIREVCDATLSKEAVERQDAALEGEGGLLADRGYEHDNGGVLAPSDGDRGDTLIGNGAISKPDIIDDETDLYPENEQIQNLTVDNLVSAAMHYCHGELPLVSRDLSLSDPSVKSLDHIPHMQQAFLHPILFIQILYLKLLYFFGSLSFRLSNIQLLVFLTFYSVLGADNITLFFPLIAYYISLVAMLICTVKMLRAKRQFIDFRKWSGLFLRYSDGNLQPDESENLYVRNNLGPFIHFFIALLINLFLYPFIATQWIPFSELTVISFFLMFITLMSFGSSDSVFPDFMAVLSFSINILAKYPYEEDTVVHQGWRFLDLHIQTYPSYIIGNGIEFCLNARVFFSLLVPVILILMARRNNWQGFYTYTIPHCVTLSWLQIFLMSSQGATMYGLVRGTLALAGVFLFLPLMGIVTLALPILACIQGITLTSLLYSVAILSAFGGSLAITCLMAKMERTKKYITPFQLTIGLMSLLYLVTPLIQQAGNGNVSQDMLNLVGLKKPDDQSFIHTEEASYSDENYYITWNDYYNYCHQPSWTDSNVAETQMKCSILEGNNVHWQGYVMDVKIVNVENKLKSFIRNLPLFIQDYVACYYGEEFSSICKGDKDFSLSECDFMQNSVKHLGRRCHLRNLDRYTYKITLQLESGVLLKKAIDLTLIVDGYFTNFTRLLKADDKLRFKGTLSNAEPNGDGSYTIGSRVPTIHVYEMFCVHCQNSAIAGVTVRSHKLTSPKLPDWFKPALDDLTASLKYILNFILNPIIVVK